MNQLDFPSKIILPKLLSNRLIKLQINCTDFLRGLHAVRDTAPVFTLRSEVPLPLRSPAQAEGQLRGAPRHQKVHGVAGVHRSPVFPPHVREAQGGRPHLLISLSRTWNEEHVTNVLS